MSLPSTVSFAAGDKDYIPKHNQFVTDLNALYDIASSLQAQLGAFFRGSSTTSNAIGTGSKVFTLVESTQRAFAVGSPVRIADTAAPSTNYMDGMVTAYSHPSITVQVSTVGGSGTKTSWSVAILPATGTIPVASGGTGATDAAGARTNLGLGTAATTAATAYATSTQGTTADNALPKAGGTMSGNIDQGNTNHTNVKVLGRSTEYDNGNSGAAKTIDWTNGQQQKVTLNSASVTLTISTPPSAGHYQLRLIQDATGSRAVTWSGLTSTRWGSATSAPAINTAANGESLLTLYYTGATVVTQTLFKIGAV